MTKLVHKVYKVYKVRKVKLKIKELPKIERPREKLQRYSVNKLSNSELLAIILGSGKKGENVMMVAKNLLRKFPTNQLSNTLINQLIEVPGIGKTKACQIIACFELGKRLLKNKQSTLIISPKDVWNELKNIRDNKKEHFVVFYLDVRNQLIKKEIVSIGSLNASLIHPREVFEPAVRNLCAQIILAHNHPSGETKPSEEDIEITKRLIEAGKILGIEIIDHVIVTKTNFFSFKEKRLIVDVEF